MKKIIFVFVLLLGFSILKADAQYVRRRPGFSVNISVGAPGPPPYREAIWVGPEWTWRGGRYVEVPGYWSKPRRQGSVWMSGGWRHEQRGYRWHRGYWR
jgi:hypothetical protein